MIVKRIFQRAWVAYNNSLQKYPYIVPSLQTSFLLGLGDVISQTCIEDSSKPFDLIRTTRFAAVGLGLGPGLRVWYGILDRFIGRDMGAKTVAKKLILDQFVFSPVVLVGFMGTLAFLQRESLASFEDNLKRNYIDILINNYKVWPAVQILNFAFVPLQFRVLVVQIVALGWNIYLAWKLHKPAKKQINK